MAGKLEDRLFPAALVLSLLGHGLLVLLRATEDLLEAPETAIEEREAQAPMTVSLVFQESLQAPVLQAEATPPILTSEAGQRVVESIELEPQQFERVRPDLPPPVTPPVELPEPTTREPEPVEEVFDLPERPQERETPPPEPPTEIKRTPSPEPPEVVLKEQQAQSAVVAQKAAPDARRNRAPDYPRRARAARMEGTAEVRVRVNAKGRVERAELVKSSGHTLLDDEAIKTVKRWRFTPAKDSEGKAAADVIVVPVTFRLKD